MYYLKCNNCGHLNEVLSETLLFCRNCNKKLANNYRDWKLAKPERTFEQFKLLVCIPGDDISKKTVRKKPNKNPAGWISLIIIFGCIFFAAYYYRGKILDYINYGKHLRLDAEQPWVTGQYGLNGFYVETPFRLKTEELKFPAEEKAQIDTCISYGYWTSANFYIRITNIKFIDQVEALLKLRDFAAGSAMWLKSLPNVSDFVYHEGSIFYKGIPGYKQTGSLIQDKVKLEFINVGYLDRIKSYQVMVAYETDDTTAKVVAERIINSIKIEAQNNY